MTMDKKEKTKAEEIALAAAREAIKELMAEQRKAKNKRIFQNTILLLEHYYELTEFCKNAEYRAGLSVANDALPSRETTLIMLSNLDTALERLKAKCEKTDIPDKYTAIDLLYLDPGLQDLDWTERLGTVCLELEKSESTIRRWIAEMVYQLGIYLFGLDGLELLE